MVGRRVECETCGKPKKPVGRDLPPGSDIYDWCWDALGGDCSGYWDDPQPSRLWPGERAPS